MITTQIKDGKTIISLEPNRSATWLQTRNMILALTGFMLLIGVGWLIAGVWMILPFVFLDICVFSYFFYRVCRETYRRQLIVIDKSKVILNVFVELVYLANTRGAVLRYSKRDKK